MMGDSEAEDDHEGGPLRRDRPGPPGPVEGRRRPGPGGSRRTTTWSSSPGKGAEDLVLAVIDGKDAKRPNAVGHPIRAELIAARRGVHPARSTASSTRRPSPSRSDPDRLGGADDRRPACARFDYRWGFQDDALMTVTRLKAPRPRAGPARALRPAGVRQGEAPPLARGDRVVHRRLGRRRQGVREPARPPDPRGPRPAHRGGRRR